MKKSKRSFDDYDLRGKRVRLGNIELRTHVSILDGWKEDKSSGRIKELVTHKDATRWDILKFQKDRAGKETCYSIATVEFEDPKTQEEFNLRSVGARLVDDIDATDLKNLKKIATMIYEHCHWMHEERLGYEHTEL